MMLKVAVSIALNVNTTMTNKTNAYYKKFTNSVLIITLIVLLVMLLLKGFKVVLLILGGVLFATYFIGIASYLNTKINMKKNIAVLITMLLTCVFLGVLVYKIAPNVAQQVVVLKEDLPKAIEKTNKAIRNNETINFLAQPILKSIEVGKKDEGGYIKTFFSSVFGVLGDFYIIIFLGFFFVANAKSYTEGLTHLFPKHRRPRAKYILNHVGYTLRNWLLGKLVSMAIVGILVTIGLYILGVPQALTLGIFTAILAFIPNIGPLISLIPAILVSYSISTELAIWTLLVYVLIQAVESNFITPMIHKQMIAMPMAMVLIAQVVLGMFTGYLGLILAVPLVAIVMVIIKKAYIEDILGDTSFKT